MPTVRLTNVASRPYRMPTMALPIRGPVTASKIVETVIADHRG